MDYHREYERRRRATPTWRAWRETYKKKLKENGYWKGHKSKGLTTLKEWEGFWAFRSRYERKRRVLALERCYEGLDYEHSFCFGPPHPKQGLSGLVRGRENIFVRFQQIDLRSRDKADEDLNCRSGNKGSPLITTLTISAKPSAISKPGFRATG